jgi:D-alanine transfer protein
MNQAVKLPHLVSSLLALLFLLVGVFAGSAYAESVENEYVHALAPAWFPQKSQGSALHKAALRQPDLLPIYGGSELGYPDPYHANAIFQNYPTGFTIYTVGRARVEPLIILEKLAAVGHDLEGKKVIITLSPDFVMVGMSSPSGYAFNFSPLHSYGLAFSTDLSEGLKREEAARMLNYPATLRKHPLLKFALERLAEG